MDMEVKPEEIALEEESVTMAKELAPVLQGSLEPVVNTRLQ